MYKHNNIFTGISNAIHSRRGQIAIMILVIALFVLSAGAPNAMGGIGK